MKNTTDTNYRVIHSQKILLGDSNKFCAGYLVINGNTFGEFIPESAGIQSLSEEQRKCITVLQPHLYVIPGLIDTNVSLHLEPYDKDWTDNKHLTMLALKNGITTIINQQLLKPKQPEGSRNNEFSNQGGDQQTKANDLNSVQENLNQKKKESIKLISEREKTEQNYMQSNTKHQPSQIFSDENEQKPVEQFEEITRGISKISLFHSHSKADHQKGDSLADILYDERDKLGYCSGVEPSTNSRTPSCVLDNQTKNTFKLKNTNQDSHLEVFCDCINMTIPESKEIIAIQMGKKTAQQHYQEIHTPTNDDNEQKKSSSSLDSNCNQDQQNHSPAKRKQNIIQSQNMIKLYTSPPFLPDISYFTKHENISTFIKGIYDKYEANKTKNDDSFDSKSSQSDEHDMLMREQERLNNINSAFSQTNNETKEYFQEQEKKANFLFDIQDLQEKKGDNEKNPFNYLNEENVKRKNEELNQVDDLSETPQKQDSQKYFYQNNQNQLSTIQEQFSQQTESNRNTHSEITESDSKASNFIQSSGSQHSQSIKAAQFCNLNSNQFSMTIKEENVGEDTDINKQDYLDICVSYPASQVAFTHQQSNNQEDQNQIPITESQLTSSLNQNFYRQDENQFNQAPHYQSRVDDEEQNNQLQNEERQKEQNGCPQTLQKQSSIKEYQYLSYEPNSYQQKNSDQLDLHRNLKQLNVQVEQQCDFIKDEQHQKQQQHDVEEIIESDEGESSSADNDDGGLICNFKIENDKRKQNMVQDDSQYDEEEVVVGVEEEDSAKIIRKKKQKKSQQKFINKPIFFIHPSSQQGDNNLSLSSPFRQQQFSERMINKNPPKVGGDALRAPFEKAYEDAINDLKQIDPDSEDYNEELKQLVLDVYEASKENSQAYTDHLINHSQLSDYNSDLMDDNDKNLPFEFKLGSLVWPQPSYELNFDKERAFFNSECNNYQPEKNIFQQQGDGDLVVNLADSQYLGNDEIRESQQNINQSVIHLDEGENDRNQLGADTLTSMKDTHLSKSFKIVTNRNSQVLIENIRNPSIQSNIQINCQKNDDGGSALIGENEDNVNKEASPKEEDTQASIQDKDFKFESRQEGVTQTFNDSSRLLKEQLSPIQIVTYDADSSNEGGKNNEPPYRIQLDSLNNLWKNSPLYKSNQKIFPPPLDMQSQSSDLKKDQPLVQRKDTKEGSGIVLPEIGLNKQFSSLEGIGVKKANSICENSKDLEESNSEQEGLFENGDGLAKSKERYLESSSESMSSREKIDQNEESKLELKEKEVVLKLPPFRLHDEHILQLKSPKQQEEVCTSQVKRRNFPLQKLDMSSSIKSQNDFLMRQSHGVSDQNISNLLRLDSFQQNINLTQTEITLNQKGDNQQVKSSMSLMERRQKSCQFQSINLEKSKQIIKPIQITNNPNADYLHFLSARPFFWEYFALQMYYQVLRSLVIIVEHGQKNKQLSRSLTSSPVTNALYMYQYRLSNQEEDIRTRSRTQSTALPLNPAVINSSAWKERLSSFSSNRNSPKQNKKIKGKNGNQIGTFIFQNVSNGLSIVRIFSMKKTFEDFAHIYTEVSWPFLFFDSTQISQGDSRFKTEPAIQNLENKQILQSCLFRNKHLINMVGSYHFTVPPKYKFFSQLQNMNISQQVQSTQNMTQQIDQFPGDFQRAINGLFSLGGQLPSLWTIAMAQTQPLKPIQIVRSPIGRSKSSSFSFGGLVTRNLGPLPSIISTPSIFKQMQDDVQGSDSQDSPQNNDPDSQIENDPFIPNQQQQQQPQQQLQQQYSYEGQSKRKSNFYNQEKSEDQGNLNDCIKNIIQKNQQDNQTASENQSPVSHKIEDLNLDMKNENKYNQILNEEINSVRTDSNGSSPKVFSFQQNQQQSQSKRSLNEQEEKNLIRIVDVLSRNPAKICNLKHTGAIEEGKNADFIIFDPLQVYEFSAFIDEKQKFPSQLHILNSQKVQGKVISTYLRGQKLYEESKFFIDDFVPIEEY